MNAIGVTCHNEEAGSMDKCTGLNQVDPQHLQIQWQFVGSNIEIEGIPTMLSMADARTTDQTPAALQDNDELSPVSTEKHGRTCKIDVTLS